MLTLDSIHSTSDYPNGRGDLWQLWQFFSYDYIALLAPQEKTNYPDTHHNWPARGGGFVAAFAVSLGHIPLTLHF